MVFPTRIYLTGFMGSGKSTIGPQLAECLSYEFVDLDKVIEDAAGTSIRQIFSERGESEFRRLESLMLRSASRSARVVIALGGGAVASENNLYFVTTNGTLVYLSVSPAILARRLKAESGERPLLCGENGRMLTDNELERRVEDLIEARQPYYRRADVLIDVGERSIEETVDATIEALSLQSQRGRVRGE